MFDSPTTQVLHNTILASGTYGLADRYRFPHSTGVQIANNLLDGRILARDGATGTLDGNVTRAPALFANPGAGDLRLRMTATAAIDRVVPTADVPVDWEGEARPQGSAADVGADEMTATVPQAPWNLRIVP